MKRLRKSYYLLLLWLLPSWVMADNTLLDSLLIELHSYDGDTNQLVFGQLLYDVGATYFLDEYYKESKNYHLRSEFLAKKNQYDRLALDNKIALGDIAYWFSSYDSAIKYFSDALIDHQDIITDFDSTQIFTQLAFVYYYKGDLTNAFTYRLKSLDLRERSGDSLSIAAGIFTLAEISFAQSDFTRAIERAEEAIRINERNDGWKEAGFCYDLIGESYLALEDYTAALTIFEKACEPIYCPPTKYNEAYCNHTIAYCHLKLNQYESAVPMFKKAMELRDEKGLIEEYIYSKIYLAVVYYKMGNYDLSLSMLKEGLSEARKINVKPLERDVSKELSEYYKTIGDFELALYHKERYFFLKDSIIGNSTISTITSLSSSYDVKHKEQELAILKKNQEVNLLYNVLLLSIAGFLLISLLYIYSYWKKQRKYASSLKLINNKIIHQNENLKSINQNLEEANRELEEFAYITSHDLKAPLRTIGSYASLIKRRYMDKLDQEGKEFFDFIVKDVAHMNALLNDVLTYSKVNKVDAGFEMVDLNETLKEVLRIVSPQIEDKKAKIISDPLPVVFGNSTQLFQVFQNLIDNALKFVANDNKPIIQIKSSQQDKLHCISVKDNGIGVSDEYLKKIFSLFKRLHNKATYHGTGVGLSICKKIIEKHGGQIWATTNEDVGTTFYFTLLRQK